MFKLAGASVHYGASSYPLRGLPEEFQRISGVVGLDLDNLSRAVGRITGFPRQFRSKHLARQEMSLPGGEPLVIPERVVAMADGYTITWNRE
jgi:hypothetical protein